VATATHRIRLELSEAEARALHAAVHDALGAGLLAPEFTGAARGVLDRLGRKVPAWLDRAPVQGEAGYLIATEAVLCALIAAEECGRSALSELELSHALTDAKPAGVTIAAVLARMRREQLLRQLGAPGGDLIWWSAAPAGRRRLTARDGAAAGEEWCVEDAAGLAELIYREYRPGRDAYRPAVQAIGRLPDCDFECFADELRTAGLLEPAGDDPCRLTLTTRGAELAEARIRPTLPRHSLIWELPPPPLPYARALPLRVEYRDRQCACGQGHAAWLKPSSKTKLQRTLRRDGAAEWDCRWCGRCWLIFLLAHRADGEPAYRDPDGGAFLRPVWRPR
jgi:hypothetical protein